MKKLIIGCCIVLLCWQAIMPSAVFAAIDEQELTDYLQELGVDKDTYLAYLEEFAWDTADFEKMDSLEDWKEYVGPELTDETYAEYLEYTGLTVADVNERLAELGYQLSDIYYVIDLEWLIGTPVTEETLEVLADELGFSLEELAELFTASGYDLYSYETIEDIYPVIYDEINPISIAVLLKEVALAQEDFEQLLTENGLTLDDFEDYYELSDFVYSETGYYDFSKEDYWELMAPFLDLLGISETEFYTIYDHLNAVVDLDPEAFLAKLEELDARLMELGDFETSTELTAAQEEELTSIWYELMELFQVKADFYLIDGDIKTPMTMEALMDVKDLEEKYLLVELYDLDGNFLLNFAITGELFGSDLFTELPEAEEVTVPEPTEEKQNPSLVKKAAAPVKAETAAGELQGQRLPDTATPIGSYLTLGVLLIGVGAAVLFIRRRKQA